MDYNGGRTADTIVQWISKRTGPSSVELACEDVEKKAADNKLNFVHTGCQECDHFKAFMEASKDPSVSELYNFFHIKD